MAKPITDVIYSIKCIIKPMMHIQNIFILSVTSLLNFFNKSSVSINDFNKLDNLLSKYIRHVIEMSGPNNFNSTLAINTIDIGSKIFNTLFTAWK